jgi:hypothetical protein
MSDAPSPAKGSFMPTFDTLYLERLAVRGPSFRLMLELLESKKKSEYFILETGCLRIPDNWFWDGMSTYVFDQFVGFHGGSVLSIDISRDNVEVARRHCSPRVKFICSDSVKFLYDVSLTDQLPEIDLLYLDSFDLDKQNPFPSAFHHVKELAAIMRKLRPGVIVCVDDNMTFQGKDVGKGLLVDEFMKNIGAQKLFDGYQMIWRM